MANARMLDVVIEIEVRPGVPGPDRARTIDRAVERLWQVFGRLVPDWLGATMFRTFVEPALRDFARDVEDELFGLVERLAKYYGDARRRGDELLVANAHELRKRLDVEDKLAAMDAAWGLSHRFQERHIKNLEEQLAAARQAYEMSRAIRKTLEAQLEEARQAGEQLQEAKTHLHGELSDVIGQLHEAKREVHRYQDTLRAGEMDVIEERGQCVRDVCAACREGRAVLRVEAHAFNQADGFYRAPTVTPMWVHPDPETAPFTECAAGAIRERVRG